MARHSSAIAAAELRVARSRRELRDGLRRLRRSLSRPSSLFAAAAVGALWGFSLKRGRTAAIAGALATASIRYSAANLIAGR